MLITVAVCTWNRAGSLDRTLSAMAGLRIPPGVDWELLVVDNNSTDGTPGVLARHARRLPLRTLREPRQGLSAARNLAVREASGDLLLWTDDDVYVDPEWMAEYVEAFWRWPEAAYFGGPIEPWFEAEPPAWIRHNLRALEGLFSIRHLGDSVRRLNYPEHPWGANMAFRTRLLRHFPFDDRMGRSGVSMVGGEESEVIFRLAREGHIGVWVGKALVRHFIGRDRLSLAYAWRWFSGHGRTIALLQTMSRGEAVHGTRERNSRQHWRNRIRALMVYPFAGPRWLVFFQRLAFLSGALLELYAEVAACGASRPACMRPSVNDEPCDIPSSRLG